MVVFQCPGLLADQPLAARAAAPGADHLGVGPGLVDEDQALGVKLALGGLPGEAALGHVRPILLGGVQSFF